jgi:hypothetical protein
MIKLGFTCVVNSNSRVSGDGKNSYIVNFPTLPKGKYKATCYFFSSGVGGQAMVQIKCPQIARALTTKQGDGFIEINQFNSNQSKVRLNNIVYFDSPPETLSVQFIAVNTGAIYALTAQQDLIINFELM